MTITTTLVRTGALSIYVEKTGDNFPPDGTVRMEKTVVPLWNEGNFGK